MIFADLPVQAGFHPELVDRTLATACASQTGIVELWCTDTNRPMTHDLVRRHGVRVREQTLLVDGLRMTAAFRSALSRTRHACVVNGHSPALTIDDLRQASGWLRSGGDAVLGPTNAGGCYLIGLRRPVLGLFDDVPGADDSLLQILRERLRRAGLSCCELAAYPTDETSDETSNDPGEVVKATGTEENCANG
ncbi:MAG: DUF2064 domain-containing protein [Gammaproteobacteria bacterium]